jgi:hypothetical protein
VGWFIIPGRGEVLGNFDEGWKVLRSSSAHDTVEKGG